MSAKKVVQTAILGIVFLLGLVAFAQTEVQGIIDGRKGDIVMLKSSDGTTVNVLLSDSTQVEEVEGGLHMRKKQMGLTALVPGLAIQVKGSTDAQGQIAADEIRFKASDLKTAQDIQAGMAPVQARAQAQETQIQAQQQAMEQQQAQLAAEEAKIQARSRPLSQLPTNDSASWATTTYLAKSRCCLPTAGRPSIRSTDRIFCNWRRKPRQLMAM